MAGSINVTPGVNLTPTAEKVALQTNYITNFDFLNQYLPDTYEAEFERYGNRSIASFLRMVGAELPTNSDLVKWNEHGRLHIKYDDITTGDADGPATTSSQFTLGSGDCAFRVNQTVFLSDNDSGAYGQGVISAVAGSNFTVEWYKAAGQPVGFQASTAITAFVYGSEFAKGTAGMQESLESQPDIFENKPIIIKDIYSVSGSDIAQIGWVKVSTEGGGGGYYWYIKSQHETRLRFEDYMEMSMVEGQVAEDGSGAEAFLSTATGGNNAGTEGLFEAVATGGNVWGGGNPETLPDFDTVIQRLDKQGSIRENVLFQERQFCFDFSDMIAEQNSYGAGGTSYGLFDNSEEMALNLGFTGFKRGYEFYQTDWKYLNDATTRGGINGGKVNGIMVPAGTTSVYDQVLGQHAKRPFLHVRYRKAPNEDRRYKTWITGSAGGGRTNDIDSMDVHFLTERCLCTMGRNNFFLFQG